MDAKSGNAALTLVKAFAGFVGVLIMMAIIGAAVGKNESTSSATIAAPSLAAPAPAVPDMAVVGRKPKKKRRKADVATAKSDDPDGVMPLANEPYELVK